MAGDTDTILIEAVRAGDSLAYDHLFRRHQPVARRVASMLWRDHAEVDDLVAESFARVLAAIRDGGGPAERFRPYLLVTLRNLAVEWARRRDRREAWRLREDGTPGVEEIVVDRLTGEVALAAFRTLPERWRYVLWHTELAGTRPGRLARELGMTPNGVAALALRAREGLRQAFLQAHVPTARDDGCRNTRRRLGAWTRGKVTTRQREAVEAHLDGCPACRRVAAVLGTLNNGLPALGLLPLLGRLLGGAPAAGATAVSKTVAVVTLAAIATAPLPQHTPPVLAAPPAAPAAVEQTPHHTPPRVPSQWPDNPGPPSSHAKDHPGKAKGKDAKPAKEPKKPKAGKSGGPKAGKTAKPEKSKAPKPAKAPKKPKPDKGSSGG
ncbi:hypothetical protein GCM10027445_46210 [Amycolatopsis endophytica]|uniref:RNA polymerase sigma factor (Sigma-70 family) n=1 Tax=Amycolatopsis endophytica TaxID=860233 RepID=A0A853BCW1_9PSEU|nr:sigma-70 family RNA polymerase sigma factor [Amycolatopsis endophytica]NYI92562.1 RNA polymerase sigma factor (sigma-70 family) [Amycolatopsis endophytica]